MQGKIDLRNYISCSVLIDFFPRVPVFLKDYKSFNSSDPFIILRSKNKQTVKIYQTHLSPK